MANIENVKKWIAALRSGEYKQGTGSLHSAGAEGEPDTYCCLGVATVVAMADGCPIQRKTKPDCGSYAYYETDPKANVSGILPPAVVKWLGLEGRDETEGSVVFDNEAGHYGKEVRDAISANDVKRWSFDQIADKLEEHFGIKESVSA